MRSSISSSKHPAFFYAKALLATCALLVLALEAGSNYLVRHHSETYARVSQQYSDALNMHPARPGEPASVLLVGNSLLLYGVDVDRLRKLTSSEMRVYPIFLEATGYYDWLYGLHRLFDEGAKPQVVVLGVGLNSFFANSVRRDYAPLMLFHARDTLSLASDLKMDRTASSDLLLAHLSVFWDTRSSLRMQILDRTVPHCEELFSLFRSQPPIPPPSEFDGIANARLERLRDLCASHGARLIILLPPAPDSEESINRLKTASEKVGVDTLVPLDPATLPANYYLPDQIHLSPEGAELFTSALAAFLPDKLTNKSPHSRN